MTSKASTPELRLSRSVWAEPVWGSLFTFASGWAVKYRSLTVSRASMLPCQLCAMLPCCLCLLPVSCLLAACIVASYWHLSSDHIWFREQFWIMTTACKLQLPHVSYVAMTHYTFNLGSLSYDCKGVTGAAGFLCMVSPDPPELLWMESSIAVLILPAWHMVASAVFCRCIT
jgi:hypothetical protein